MVPPPPPHLSLLTLSRVSCGSASSLALFLAHISSSRDTAEQSSAAQCRPASNMVLRELGAICSLSHFQKELGSLGFGRSGGNKGKPKSLVEAAQPLHGAGLDLTCFSSRPSVKRNTKDDDNESLSDCLFSRKPLPALPATSTSTGEVTSGAKVLVLGPSRSHLLSSLDKAETPARSN